MTHKKGDKTGDPGRQEERQSGHNDQLEGRQEGRQKETEGRQGRYSDQQEGREEGRQKGDKEMLHGQRKTVNCFWNESKCCIASGKGRTPTETWPREMGGHHQLDTTSWTPPVTYLGDK